MYIYIYIIIFFKQKGTLLFYEPHTLCQRARQKKASYSGPEKLVLNWLQKSATNGFTLDCRMLKVQREYMLLLGGARLAMVREIWTRQRCHEVEGKPSHSSKKVRRLPFRKSFARSKIYSVSNVSSFSHAFCTLRSCVKI